MIGDGYISYPFLSVELGIDMGIGNDLLQNYAPGGYY